MLSDSPVAQDSASVSLPSGASEPAAGVPLADLLTSAGPEGLGTDVILRISLDALEALAAAHTRSPAPLVHGEISPQQIVVGRDGAARVVGFGSADTPPAASASAAKNQARLGYAAPERVKGMSGAAPGKDKAAADPRSDLFSIGVVVWEGIARQRLFGAKMDAAVIQKVLTAPIASLTSLPNVSVSAALDAAVLRSLERDPARRHQTAAELIEALRAAGGTEIAPREKVATIVEKLAGPSNGAQQAKPGAAQGAPAAPAAPAGPKRPMQSTLLGMAPVTPAQVLALAQQERERAAGVQPAAAARPPANESVKMSKETPSNETADTAKAGESSAVRGAVTPPATPPGAPAAPTAKPAAPTPGAPPKPGVPAAPAIKPAAAPLGAKPPTAPLPRPAAPTAPKPAAAPAATPAAAAGAKGRFQVAPPAAPKPGAKASEGGEESAGQTAGAGAAPAKAEPAKTTTTPAATAPAAPTPAAPAAPPAPAAAASPAAPAAPAAPTAAPAGAPKPPIARPTPGAKPTPPVAPKAAAPAAPPKPAAPKPAAAATPPIAAAKAPVPPTAPKPPPPGGAALKPPIPAAGRPAPAAPPVEVTAVPVEAASGSDSEDESDSGHSGSTPGRSRAAEALDKIRPGSTLGRYEILMPMAKGGMASVWAARLQGTRGFQKIVAIKTMLPDVSDDPEFESMFLDEARVAARIRHPNVVEIYDLGEQDDVLYIVMEWIEGDTLTTMQKAAKQHGGIPLPILLRVASQVCAGLHSAHELRDDAGALVDLIHRDISPGNILVSSSGFAKIADFGIAKSKGRLHVTRGAGVLKGKTPYLSPEQLRGMSIDRRSDIFSLGTLLYVMTTGLHPFRAETEAKTMEKIALHKPVAIRDVVPTVNPEWEKLIFKALEKDRANRFATAGEMQRAIDQLASSIGAPTTDEDVAAFVQTVSGESLKERAKNLRAAIATADGPAAASAHAAGIAAEAKVEAATGAQDAGNAAAAAAATGAAAAAAATAAAGAAKADASDADAAANNPFDDITIDEDLLDEASKNALAAEPAAAAAPAPDAPAAEAPPKEGALVVPIPAASNPGDINAPKVMLSPVVTDDKLVAAAKDGGSAGGAAAGAPAGATASSPSGDASKGDGAPPWLAPPAASAPAVAARATPDTSSLTPPLMLGASSSDDLKLEDNPFAPKKRSKLVPLGAAGALLIGIIVGATVLSGGKPNPESSATPERTGSEPTAAVTAVAAPPAESAKPAESAGAQPTDTAQAAPAPTAAATADTAASAPEPSAPEPTSEPVAAPQTAAPVAATPRPVVKPATTTVRPPVTTAKTPATRPTSKAGPVKPGGKTPKFNPSGI